MTNYMDNNLPKRLAFAAVGAALFILAGRAIPDIYFHYFDKTQYYTVVQPIPVNKKWFKPCENVTLTSTRNSQLDLSLSLNVNLILRRGDNNIFFVPNVDLERTQTAKAGNNVTVQTSYPLPCDLDDGLYYWQMVATYHVYGYEHTYLAISDTFNVNELGADPNVIKQATASASLTGTPSRVTTQTVGRTAVTETRATPAPTTTLGTQNSTPQAGSSGQQTTNVNIQQPQSTPQPTPQPQPTPVPTPADNPIVCILGICIP